LILYSCSAPILVIETRCREKNGPELSGSANFTFAAAGRLFGLERLAHIFLILRLLCAAYQKKALPLTTIVATGDPDFAGMISSANQLPKLSP